MEGGDAARKNDNLLQKDNEIKGVSRGQITTRTNGRIEDRKEAIPVHRQINQLNHLSISSLVLFCACWAWMALCFCWQKQKPIPAATAAMTRIRMRQLVPDDSQQPACAHQLQGYPWLKRSASSKLSRSSMNVYPQLLSAHMLFAAKPEEIDILHPLQTELQLKFIFMGQASPVAEHELQYASMQRVPLTKGPPFRMKQLFPQDQLGQLWQSQPTVQLQPFSPPTVQLQPFSVWGAYPMVWVTDFTFAAANCSKKIRGTII